MAHSADTQQQALNLYLKDNESTRISKMIDVPKRTVDSWIKTGVLVDGENWRDYRERMNQAALNAARTHELEKRSSDNRVFTDKVKDDLQNIVYEQMIVKFREGTFDVSVKDMLEVVKAYSILENGAAEKLAFASWFIDLVMKEVGETLDERTFKVLTAKLRLRRAEVEAKLDPLSVAAGLPQLNARN